ncbi:MAG: cyclic nucleotide-binding domain-containing protein [Acidimicrobiales bacterium]
MRLRRDDPRIELSRLDLFADCSRAELGRIALLVTRVTVPEGYVLIRQGGPGDEFMVLVDGTASVRRRTPLGDDEVARLGPGDFVGEMALLPDRPGTRRTATVVAATDVTLAVCTPGEFRQILELAPSVAEKVQRSADRRGRRLLVASA